MAVAPPPPALSIAIGRFGTSGRHGEVTLHGTVTCSTPMVTEVYGSVQQPAGRHLIHADFYGEVECDGQTNWSMTGTSYDGIFSGGPAQAAVYAFGCEGVECAYAEASRTVRLRRAG
ncbi:MAG: hypothetical protein ACRDJ4_07670 [Actinomycetota bacterium]